MTDPIYVTAAQAARPRDQPPSWWRSRVLVTAVEAAAECGVTVKTVREWTKAGVLDAAPFTRWTGARRAVLYEWGQVIEVKTMKGKP